MMHASCFFWKYFSPKVLLVSIFLLSQSITIKADDFSSLADAEIRTGIEKLPVVFRENKGQWDKDILYKGFSPGWEANVHFMKNGLSLGFRRKIEKEIAYGPTKMGEMPEDEHEYLVWNLLFKGANADVLVSTAGEQESRTNYLLGNDPSKYIINVPDHRIIRYKNIYQGIDVNYYSTGKNLKYDYIIHPGAELNKLQLSCGGIKELNINSKGQLEISTPWGTLIEEIPESYQMVNGQKKLIKVSYKLIDKTTFTFGLSKEYDESKELVIDPVTLEWSTFVGGGPSGQGGFLHDIAKDPAGFIYGVGKYDDYFPTTPGVYDPTYNGKPSGGAYGDDFLFKLDPTGSSLIFATYIGGTGIEMAHAVAVNATGEAFIAGYSSAPDFPTTPGAFSTINKGGLSEITVTRLNSTGTALIYSTYIGGTSGDMVRDLAVNSLDEAFITGSTSSADFPTTPGAWDGTYGGNQDAYVLKLNAAGSALIYSTFLGAQREDVGVGIAINAVGEAFVAGATSSAGFPKTFSSLMGYRDIFVTKVNAAGTGLIYSALVGSTDDEVSEAIAINAAGEAYVAGVTCQYYIASNNFPTTVNAYDKTYNGGIRDAVIFKLNSAGNALIYSTYLGGSGDENWIDGLAINADGEAYISGVTHHNSFPTTKCATDSTYNPPLGYADVFVSKLNATGSSLMYSTFMGGSVANTYFTNLLLNEGCSDEVIVACSSHSSDFPTTPGAYQTVKLNGFMGQPAVFKLKPKLDAVGFSTSPNPTCNVPINFTDTTNQCGLWDTLNYWQWDFGDGNTSNLQYPVHTYSMSGTYNVTLIVGCPMDTVIMPLKVGSSLSCCYSKITNTLASPLNCYGDSNATVTLNVSGVGPFTYTWSNGFTSSLASISGLAAGTHSVSIADTSGCMMDTVINITQPLPVTATINGPPIVCAGSTAQLSIAATGGSSVYGYAWNTGQATGTISHSPASATVYTSTVTDTKGCIATASLIVGVVPLPDVSAEFSDSSGCPQLCIDFNNTSQNINSLAWDFGDGSTSSSDSLGHCYDAPGLYSVSLTVTDNNGCSNTLTKDNFIEVFSAPVADFMATPPITTVLNGMVQFTDKSSGANVWNWSFGDVFNSGSTIQHPEFMYTDSGNYVIRLVVSNNFGCMDSTERLVRIRPEFALYIPNSFTPNGDNTNEEFIAQGLGIDSDEFEMMIFDRWGDLIWKSTIWGQGWNGKANDGKSIAQQDVYVWRINCRDTEGTKHRFMGHVNLVR